MKRVAAPERTRERLRALMDGRLGTAPDRSNLVLLAAQLIVEEALEAEVRDEVGRERYERADGEASGYRNGYRTGRMKTAEGVVEFAAPQVRDTAEPFVSGIRQNLAGRTGALEDLAVELYARGLSTRDIEDAFTDEAGRRLLSRAAVSEITERLWAEYEAFTTRDLSDPLLVVSDGAPGIIRAIEECFPRSARQRCLAHRMRNLAVKVPTDLWPEFKARASACYQAPSRAIARDLAKGIRADYGTLLPSAVACFEDDFEACIAHLRLPVTHRRSTRTTNLLERLFGEERRRLKIIPNGLGEKPVLKLMFGALVRAAERWRGLRFTEFELRQIAAVRKDLDAEYEATRSDRASQTRVSSRSAP